MGKKVAIAGIAFCFILPSFYCSLAQGAGKVTKIEVRKGKADLRSVDFSISSFSIIKGDWKFYKGLLLTPEQTKNRRYQYKRAPASWDTGVTDELFGVATYQLEILLPEKHPQLTLYFPMISSATKIWINENLAVEQGALSTNPDSHHGTLGHLLINLPDNEELVLLTIQVSNFSFPASGILATPTIGLTSALYKQLNTSKGWANLYSGSLIALSILHLILFTLYRKEKSYLILVFICLSVSVRAMVRNQGALFLPDLMPLVDIEYWKRLEYFSVYSLLILFPLYICSTFRYKCPEKPIFIFSGLGVLFCATTLLTSVTFFMNQLDYAHAIFVLEFIFAGVVFTKNRYSEEARIILFGLLASLPFIFFEILANSGVITIQISNRLELGTLIFFLFQSFLLAKKNAKAFFWADKLNRTLENVVEERTQELQISNQVKDTLISVISHDLKSPINSLKGTLNLLNQGYTTMEENKTLLDRVENQMGNVSFLLDNLLSWSSTQTEGIKVNKSKLDLSKIVSDYTGFFLHSAEIKNISIINGVMQNIFVLADPDIVGLALRNVLSNAIKFTPVAGTIEICATIIQEKIQLRIRDNGNGMSEEMTAQILNTERITTPGTGNEKGHGLGLSLTRKFLNAMGAEIQVESKLFQGTTFSITLDTYTHEGGKDFSLTAQNIYEEV
jgi:signal transduction histidine kinase